MQKIISNKPLELINVTKTYGASRGIENISLKLNQGEVFGFLGPNGAGKSTTIKTILNFLAPSKGKILIFGLDGIKASTILKQHMGYLSGDFSVYENLTGRQLLTFLGSFNEHFNWQEVQSLTKIFKAELDKKIADLSKGNKQKLGIIQAFMHKPKLLILDEPTSGLDPIMQEAFFALLKKSQKEGATIFFSSHNIFEVQRIADRAGFIRNGKLIAIEDIKNLRKIGLHKFEIHFSEKVTVNKLEDIKNVKDIRISDNIARVSVKGSIDPLIKRLAKFNVLSISQQETNLEDIFLNYYQSGEEENEII